MAGGGEGKGRGARRGASRSFGMECDCHYMPLIGDVYFWAEACQGMDYVEQFRPDVYLEMTVIKTGPGRLGGEGSDVRKALNHRHFV